MTILYDLSQSKIFWLRYIFKFIQIVCINTFKLFYILASYTLL